MKKLVLAGNPNVGKSTVFNALTGMRQHTGNWPGKTVGNAIGNFSYQGHNYILYDLPGTYSLISHSKEETVARDFICYQEKDLVIVVCDSLCLERNLNLVLQILEITDQVIICVNLMDEAKKKHVKINLKKLEKKLGVPVVGTSARSKKGLKELVTLIDQNANLNFHPTKVHYGKVIEEKIELLEQEFLNYDLQGLSPRWLALKILERDEKIYEDICQFLGYSLLDDDNIMMIVKKFAEEMEASELKDYIVSQIMKKAEEIVDNVVIYPEEKDLEREKIDRFLTNKWTGIPVMILLFMLVFWITITGANYPSSLLYDLFFSLTEPLRQFCGFLHFPTFLTTMLVDGAYGTLAWVVSVMLPPMAIFFPLFTILEDFGYLPRMAFNLDRCFQKCCACGKQALTMCMGFGCNAVGITGCRIIDSPRERLVAILTNNFVPCNGRFPTIIAFISMFLVGFQTQSGASFFEVLLLIGFVLLGIFMTFLVSYLLSKTILRGKPSSFTLELPPYRKPQFMRVIIRSVFDKTLHVLGRAVVVAIPAGIVIWLLANIQLGDHSLLRYLSDFLDPFGKLIGLDGVIVTSFLLGFPANEIVLPIMIMSYMSLGNMVEFQSLAELKMLLVDNGWTTLTAINAITICLMHFPCSTTCLTIRKETGSWKWVGLAILIPTVCGILICLLNTILFHLFF
ncbi:MAG: ferrous iron transport protein B [bacterium]|nr:ferrous iron transport protein B [bacterium]